MTLNFSKEDADFRIFSRRISTEFYVAPHPPIGFFTLNHQFQHLSCSLFHQQSQLSNLFPTMINRMNLATVVAVLAVAATAEQSNLRPREIVSTEEVR